MKNTVVYEIEVRDMVGAGRKSYAKAKLSHAWNHVESRVSPSHSDYAFLIQALTVIDEAAKRVEGEN